MKIHKSLTFGGAFCLFFSSGRIPKIPVYTAFITPQVVYHRSRFTQTRIICAYLKGNHNFQLSITQQTMPSASEKLSELRELCVKNELQAYIVPSDDAHSTEIPAKHDQRREFISNFTGSAGTVVVTHNKAGLWTDGRYYTQAENELSKDWTLHKMIPGKTQIDSIGDFLLVETTGKVGLDGSTISLTDFDHLQKRLGSRLVAVNDNLIDTIWEKYGRPTPPIDPFRLQPIELTGIDVSEKLTCVRKKMKEKNASLLLLFTLDEICWMLNIRGNDVPFAPLVTAYLIIPAEESPILFVDDRKVNDNVKAYFEKYDITIKPYNKVTCALNDLAKKHCVGGRRLWLDSRCNYKVYHAALRATSGTTECQVCDSFICSDDSPVGMLKAIKTKQELEGMRQCHIRDGAALSKFLCWLEGEIYSNQDHALTECSIAKKLEEFRAAQKDFIQVSFDSIVGCGPNGAIIHYRPMTETCRKIDKDMLLIDSGGQYLDGTTDVTRTIHLGEPTLRQKECFTRVLMGHIDLARAVFPSGTTGPQLDVLARRPLWEVGLDYRHGTGHGVGAYLCVHEGPCAITSRAAGRPAMVRLEPRMVLSNEPGYYENGEFGIRIESLISVNNAHTRNKFEDTEFYSFETLTKVPIQRKCIQLELLRSSDVEWLNDYHSDVYEKLESLMETEDQKKWLLDATRPIVLFPTQGYDNGPPASLYE